MKKRVKLSFTDSISIIEATESGLPSFSMVAYTGGAMRLKGYKHPVVVDLEGIRFEDQSIPVRLNHQPEQGVGHTTRIEIENGRLVASGIISRGTVWAQDVAQAGKAGYPWQASMGGPVEEVEFYPEGENVIVNAQTFEGPLYVVRKMSLIEISMVERGADDKTRVLVAKRVVRKIKERKMAKKTNHKEDETKTVNEGVVMEEQLSLQAQEVQEPEPVALEPVEQSTVVPPITAMETVASEDVDSYRQRMAAERLRVAQITQLGAGEYPDLEAQAISDGWSSEKFELELLRHKRPQHVGTTSVSIPSNKVVEAIAQFAGGVSQTVMEAQYDERTLEAAERYRGVGIQEFAEVACGRRLPRFRSDGHAWLEAAFSTASLPGILSNLANKALLEGYNYVEDSWRRVCRIAAVNDFKEHTRYRMNGSFKFEPVSSGGELRHGHLGEQAFTQKADTHGIMFALTRQMIIDDNLGALNDIPRQIGMGAAEAICEAVWGLLLSNPASRTADDSNPFFHANHGNLITGSDSALSVDALTAAEVAFGAQTKPNGRPLGFMPSILLVPRSLSVTASVLMKSMNLNETTVAGVPSPILNPHAGKYEVVTSSYLNNSSFSGYSSTAWYLLTDPNRLAAMEVAFLDGKDRPTVERADADFDTLGIQYRGYIDFGVREQDYRGAQKNTGA